METFATITGRLRNSKLYQYPSSIKQEKKEMGNNNNNKKLLILALITILTVTIIIKALLTWKF